MLRELHVDKQQAMEKAGIVAEKIRAVIAEPFLLACKQEGGAEVIVEHHCTSSIGVVVFRGQEEAREDILKWADMAMYQAKAQGRNAIRFFHMQSDPARH